MILLLSISRYLHAHVLRPTVPCFQMYVDDESFIDMATSISGSGPAYIFMVRCPVVRVSSCSTFFSRGCEARCRRHPLT